jgi:hypothetical protein
MLSDLPRKPPDLIRLSKRRLKPACAYLWVGVVASSPRAYYKPELKPSIRNSPRKLDVRAYRIYARIPLGITQRGAAEATDASEVARRYVRRAAEYRYLAYREPLTALPNRRRAFDDHIVALSNPGQHNALLVIDVEPSTISRRSTTPRAMTSATRCWSDPDRRSAVRYASVTRSRVSVATSSPSFCPYALRSRPAVSPNRSARPC